MLRIAQDFGAQNERLRQRTCFDCRTLQNGKFATQSTALATKQQLQQQEQLRQQQRRRQRTQIALIATNFCSYSHPLEPLLDLLACGQVSSSTWRGDCRADLQRESTIVRQVKHPQLEICPALESAPQQSPRQRRQHDELRFGLRLVQAQTWAFLRI